MRACKPGASPSKLSSPLAPEPSNEERFLKLLPFIDRVVARLVRHYRLTFQDGEDFAQDVKAKFVANDYLVLRKFRGDCSLETYVTAVITSTAKDFLNSRWGKFRSSAAARRAGPVAMQLEQLVVRDQMSFDEACEQLWSKHGITLSRAELEEMFARLPPRTRRRFASLDEVENTLAPDRADDDVDRAERQSFRKRLTSAIGAELASWPAEDAAIMAYRFRDGRKVGEIAAMLGLEEKRLFPRIQTMIARLKAALKTRGFDLDGPGDLFHDDE
jgi:RNA polymerase sigma factor (sigma-70 family)